MLTSNHTPSFKLQLKIYGKCHLLNHRVTESIRLEQTSEIIEYNLWPRTTVSTRAWHHVPHPVFPWTHYETNRCQNVWVRLHPYFTSMSNKHCQSLFVVDASWLTPFLTKLGWLKLDSILAQIAELSTKVNNLKRFELQGVRTQSLGGLYNSYCTAQQSVLHHLQVIAVKYLSSLTLGEE